MHRPNRRVLLVDDDDAVRRATAGLLESAGFEVLEAATGRAALAMLDARSTTSGNADIDLLATDLDMPGMNGLALARVVRVCWPAIPVLLMSGRDAPAASILERMHVCFVGKPFLIDEFLRAAGDATTRVEVSSHPRRPRLAITR